MSLILITGNLKKASHSTSKRFPANKLILLFTFLVLLGLSLLVRNKFRHYAILVTPAIDLAMAIYLVDGFEIAWQGRIQDYFHRATLGLAVVLVILNWQVIKSNPNTAYQRVARELGVLAQPGERIMGPETYWFSLHNHSYMDWIQLVIYQRYAPGSTLEHAFLALHPDLFIVDGYMGVFIADQAGNTPFLRHFRLSKTELQDFLADHATLIASIDEAGWIPLQVYRINWQSLNATAAIN